MKTTVRRCASLIGVLALAMAMLVPAAAFAHHGGWTIDRLVLEFDDGSTYDTADDGGAALTHLAGADYQLWDDESNVLHVSCSVVLTTTPGQVVHPTKGTLTITDYYLDAINPGGQDTPACGNPDLLTDPDPEVCPDGTDHAGTPMDEVDDCDDPEEPEVCPDGTDHAGTPMDEVDDCDDAEQEPEVCPEGTDHAGTPMDDVEDCDDPELVEIEDLVCPEGTDNAGAIVGDLDDCDDTEVLGEVIDRRVDADDDVEVVAVADQRELPRTGADSPLSLLLIGLGLLALGAGTLRRTRIV